MRVVSSVRYQTESRSFKLYTAQRRWHRQPEMPSCKRCAGRVGIPHCSTECTATQLCGYVGAGRRRGQRVIEEGLAGLDPVHPRSERKSVDSWRLASDHCYCRRAELTVTRREALLSEPSGFGGIRNRVSATRAWCSRVERVPRCPAPPAASPASPQYCASAPRPSKNFMSLRMSGKASVRSDGACGGHFLDLVHVSPFLL